ncbi:MAG TPA: sigma 54-interacting transcriptional regulator [Syntrophales bacterium]|jgi:DNA-binding NtrC family response regulator|nr:sigma 54-interacting transcriptional regulator [Syntrophales bacterium]HQA82357.1 sigma 54-interacting transcriptional regulator [Syntrophales bacterium]
MPRIDFRINQAIDGEIVASTLSAGDEKHRPVIVANLSLGGALVEGEIDGMDHVTRLRLLIGDRDDLELPATVIWKEKNRLRLSFYYDDEDTLNRLWSYLRRGIEKMEKEQACPYCDRAVTGKPDECPFCHLSLKLSDDYLSTHTKKTFFQRLGHHLRGLNGDGHLRLLNMIDREILKEKSEEGLEEYVGTCRQMLELFSLIRKVAPTEMPVLLLGESGTGKELAAQAIHERSSRSKRPLHVINCAAIPETLLEAELFGHERGAFTGAYQARKGKFELAEKGTLFLDEIGEMPWSLQAKLLRFLEDKMIERIGCQKARKVDARIIAATNRELEREVHEGNFRQDLYYRLSVFPIHLPPLRERGADKIILAKYFLGKFCREDGSWRKKRFSAEALDAIHHYEWPGNVRELINKVRKGIVVSESDEITVGDLDLVSPFQPENDEPASLEDIRSSYERKKLQETIDACGGNLSRSARELHISRTTLHKLKKKYRL